jgi:hypothetical protein
MFSIFGEGLGCDFERGFCELAAALVHAQCSMEVGFLLICFDCALTGRNYMQAFRTIFLGRVV